MCVNSEQHRQTPSQRQNEHTRQQMISKVVDVGHGHGEAGSPQGHCGRKLLEVTPERFGMSDR